ncbi:LysR family transcriptional regulator [Sphingomonas sp. Leaf17]|uniref:LysR family transcriptional regulator n=1 Tax=Sphingomonas sp. Leaf17 TaxID=1735683 RepID=UPI0006FC0690|nr:LysR family transcriptional regulator [Sphingomonas sp. Leaf17]KQM68139.1 LysR family transcriptional regulator [Sphingomonas sp. Leaf17]
MDPDSALFVDVVTAGSLSAAARARGISPAMVSKRIARLEARLGVRLLHRTTRRLEPTARGERFHADMVQVLAAIRAAEARVADGRDAPSGPLRISAPTSFGRLHVAPHLAAFLDAYPGIALELNLSDGFADLIGEGIDLAIRIAPRVEPALVAHRLADSRRILCAAPAYLAARGVPVDADALADHRLLAATGQMPWRLADGITIDRASHVRTNSSEVVRELAIAGVGIALRSLWDVSADLAAGRLVRVLPAIEGSADVGIYAVHPRGSPVPAGVTALLDYLRALWSPAPSWES